MRGDLPTEDGCGGWTAAAGEGFLERTAFADDDGVAFIQVGVVLAGFAEAPEGFMIMDRGEVETPPPLTLALSVGLAIES
jgi:hypothetical protein